MKQKGFTLIELSVVVVIIGLLLSGIIGAQSLIGSAKAKDVIAIVEDIRAGVALFKKRYGYLPGDLPFTANEILGVVAAGNGGTIGNGSIEGAINAQGQAAVGSEVAEAPWQLYNAGMLGKINASDLQRRIITSFGSVHLASGATVNGLIPGYLAENPVARNAILFFNLPCTIVDEVDIKIDDGVATAGRAMGVACANGTVQWYAVAL